MPVYSRNSRIVKIMDNDGNTIIDLEDLQKTSIIQHDNSIPIYFSSESGGKLSDYTIHGNVGGVGSQTNLFNPLMCTIVSRYLSLDNYGKVVDSTTSQYSNAKSVIFSAPEPGVYVFSCRNRSGLTIDRMRIGLFDVPPSAGETAREMMTVSQTDDGYTYSLFSVPLGAKYIMAYLWSGTGDTEDYTTEFIETLLSNEEFQLTKGEERLDYIPPVIDRVHITVTGKNLFDKNLSPVLNCWAKFGDLSWYSSGSAWSVIIPCLPNTTYTLSKGTSNRFQISTFSAYPVIGSYALRRITYDSTTTNLIFTTNEGEYYIAFLLYYGNNFPATIVDTIQFEIGNELTNYEEFKQYDISIPINDELSTQDYVNQTSGVEIPIFAGVNELKIHSHVAPKRVKISGRIESFDDL